MSDNETNYDDAYEIDAYEIAIAMRDVALRKAEELGTDNVALALLKATDLVYDAIKRYAVLLAVFGPEKLSEFAKFLEQIELEKAVKEAEDVLKEGSDGQG